MDERACVMEALRLAGSIILENGGETYRVEDTVERLGRALGAEDVQPFAVPSGVFITANFPDGSMSTKVYRARSSGKHLKKVDEVNRISRLAAEGRIGTRETLEALRAVKNEGSAYRLPLRVFANAASAGGFTAMFGGGWIDALIAFLSGALIQLALEWCEKHIVFNRLTGIGMIDAMTGGLLMPLVPGLPMTNAVQDAMRGDVLSGVGHGMQAVLTAVLVAGGGVAATRALWMLLA